MKANKIRLTSKQIQYVMESMGIEDQNEAVDAFARLMSIELVDPVHMAAYVDKMMAKNKGR